MRIRDVLQMAIHNLWQRRLRTIFNLTGIVMGCVVLLMTAAGTSGARRAIHALFDSSDFARQIYIFTGGRTMKEPPEGEIVVDAEMSDARRERIRKALITQWNQDQYAENPEKVITLTDLESIRRLPHVVAVVPEATTACVIRTAGDSVASGITAMNIHSQLLKKSLLAGTLPDANDREGVLVNEFVAWQMGFRNDSDLPKLVGQPLTIEYQLAENRVANIYRLLTEQWNAMGIDEIQKQTQFLNTLLQLVRDLDSTSLSEEQKQQFRDLIGRGFQATGAGPDPEAASEIEVKRTFIVRGIVYSGDDNPVASLFRQWFHNVREGLQIHPDVATEIYLSSPDRKWFYNATVMVEGSAHLRNVTDALREQQFEPQSSLAVLEHIDFQIEQSGWVVYVIAVAILLTAAVGISNTLMMSVVERTPEFGIMKSIGSQDAQVLWLMIAEGAILGAFGAGLAILLSLLTGYCGQSLLKWYVESRTQAQLAGDLFQFDVLPAIAILLISVTLCILASLLPAWRAAHLDPVVAMRRT